MPININEIDNSGGTVQAVFAGIPAAVIGTAQTGPAFVPQLVNSEDSFKEIFGNVDSAHWGSVAVRAWYNEAQANAGLVYLRVLGVGDGKKRTTNNVVTNAGFVVGSNNVRTELEKSIYSSVNVGALESNPWVSEVAITTAGRQATNVIDTPDTPAAHSQTIIISVGGSTVLTITTDTGVAYTATPTLAGNTHTLGLSGSPTDEQVYDALSYLINQLDDVSATNDAGTSVTITADVAETGTYDIAVTGTYISGGHAVSTATTGASKVQSSAAPGRTYFLSTIMSESAGSSYLRDAGYTGNYDPVLRAVILVASGVQLQLSGWSPGDSGEASLTGSLHSYGDVSGSFDAGNWIGAYDASTAKVKLILNGLKSSASRILEVGLDPDQNGYMAGLNTDPTMLDQKGHYLYAHYPVPSALAVPSQQSGVIHSFSQVINGQSNTFYHNVLLTTGSASRNQYGASGYKPNFEGWEDRFSTPFTPWVISQPVGGVETKLFRLHALDDGQGAEDQFFAEISNIVYPENDDEWTTFNLTVRGYGTSDGDNTQANPLDNQRYIFSYSNLTLDPNDDNYIARVIGDYHRYYNFDVNTDEQKLVLAGMYENQNRYFRVEVTSDVSNGKNAKNLVPFGYQGIHHLVTSGSGEMLSPVSTTDVWSNKYTKLVHGQTTHILSSSFAVGSRNIAQGMFVPPVPFRTRIMHASTDQTIYPWGMRFDRPAGGTLTTNAVGAAAAYVSLTGDDGSDGNQKVNNSTNLWANGTQTDLIRQLVKFYPSYSGSPMWVGDNAGEANTSAGSILDANEFNKNKFTLSRVYVAENASSNPDPARWHQARYIRNGSNPGTSGFRFFTAIDLKKARETQKYASFVLPFQGGFDGLNIFDNNKSKMNHWSAHFEQENPSTQGGLLGPTVAAFRKGIDIIAEKTDVDINALAIPGQRSTFITDYASARMEERFDAIYLMDIEQCSQFGSTSGNVIFDGNPQSVLGNVQVNTFYTVERFATRGLSTSFSAAYFPNVGMEIKQNGLTVSSHENVPASIAALAAFAKTDRVEGAWGTPAGYTNGRPTAITSTTVVLTADDSRTLTVNSINPIIVFNDNIDPQQLNETDLTVQGTGMINGQRTLLNKESALSRLDVRKLMVYIRRQTRNIAYKYIFEPNQPSVLSRFSREVENLLANLVTAGAVAQYRVVIDDTTTSQADIENNTVRGKVFVQPYRSVEIIAIDININNSDQA